MVKDLESALCETSKSVCFCFAHKIKCLGTNQILIIIRPKKEENNFEGDYSNIINLIAHFI